MYDDAAAAIGRLRRSKSHVLYAASTRRSYCCMYVSMSCCDVIAGVTDYLNTEISTSKQKKFSLVTFVDTPGLVDGDMKYPFDVNQSIQWLGKRCRQQCVTVVTKL